MGGWRDGSFVNLFYYGTSVNLRGFQFILHLFEKYVWSHNHVVTFTNCTPEFPGYRKYVPECVLLVLEDKMITEGVLVYFLEDYIV